MNIVKYIEFNLNYKNATARRFNFRVDEIHSFSHIQHPKMHFKMIFEYSFVKLTESSLVIKIYREYKFFF